MNLAVLGYGLTQNLGDPIQAYAMLELLSRSDVSIVDRDHISDFNPKDPTQLVTSGWMIGNGDFVEFNSHVSVIGMSLHVSGWPYFGRTRRLVNELPIESFFLRELRKAGTVGTRDLYTLGELRRNGIPSFFSGCATLAFANRDSQKEIDVLCIDIDEDVATHVELDLHREVYRSSNSLSPDNQVFMTRQQITDISEPYLNLISSANVVITSRLHAALPAISQGVPVIFAPQDRFDKRFSGYSSLFPYIVNSSDLKAFVSSLLESISLESPDLGRIKESIKSNLCVLLSQNGIIEERKLDPLPLKFTISERETLMSYEEDFSQSSGLLLNEGRIITDFLEVAETKINQVIQERDQVIQERDQVIQERDQVIQERNEIENSITWRLSRPIRVFLGRLGNEPRNKA